MCSFESSSKTTDSLFLYQKSDFRNTKLFLKRVQNLDFFEIFPNKIFYFALEDVDDEKLHINIDKLDKKSFLTLETLVEVNMVEKLEDQKIDWTQ